MATTGDPRSEILAVIDRYATALDRRDWELLDQVFSEDLTFDAGEWVMKTRVDYVRTVRGYLDGCGPTQHLLGNYRIQLQESGATSQCYVRAFHRGLGELADTTYEMGGEYRDELQRTAQGWRIHHRILEVRFEMGSRDVLRGAP